MHGVCVREVSPPVGGAPDLAIEVGGDLTTFPHPRRTDAARALSGYLASHLGAVLLSGFAAWGLVLPVPCRAQSPISSNFPRFDWEPTISPPGARYAGSGLVCRWNVCPCYLVTPAPRLQSVITRPGFSPVRSNSKQTFAALGNAPKFQTMARIGHAGTLPSSTERF